MKCYKTYVGRFLIKNQVLGSKCPRHFGTGAEVSCGHFGTSAEMSWVRSVLGPKCPYTFGNTESHGQVSE